MRDIVLKAGEGATAGGLQVPAAVTAAAVPVTVAVPVPVGVPKPGAKYTS